MFARACDHKIFQCSKRLEVRLEEFLKEKRLRWLGHVERMDEERGPVKALFLEVDGTKKERPKKRWKEVLECDMTARGLQRLDAQDR